MNKSITRRVIAIMFAACGAGVLSYQAIQGEQSALTALISIVSMVVAFYFGTKASQI